MICCTEPELTEALYMYIVHTFNNITDNRLITAVTVANDRPILSSERAPHVSKPATV
jgi:hypothetical protein